MLRIPTPSDTPPPLMAPLRRVQAEPEATADPGVLKKRRRSKKGKGDSHSWEHQPRASRSGSREKNQMRLMLFGGAALFAGIVAGVFFLMSGGGKPPATPVADGGAAAVIPPKPVDVTEPPVVARGEAALLAEAQPLAKKFLEAKTVEEMLPLVRDPDVTEKRMRAFYQEDGVSPPGLSRFNPSGGASVKGKMVSITVVTRDFEQKSMAFLDTAQGLKIDWESWAGWSEMSWKTFRSEKPAEAHVFRVTLSPVEYYNFTFADESKWKSYRLVSPDGEHSIYGYVEKDSMLAQQIRLDADTKKVSMMLSLKFPAGATADNQVVIDRFVTDGWVEEVAP